MANDLIKFRCYQCDKLLGAPTRKAGRTTTCPTCKAELIVPDPAESAVESETALFPPINDPEPIRKSPPVDRPPSHDPAFSWEQIDPALFAPGESARIPTARLPVETTEAEDPAIKVVAKSTVLGVTGADLSGSMPSLRVEAEPGVRSSRVEGPRRRSTDVVLSQAVLSSWASFALLALAIAFLAGLFVGHFVWRPR